MSHQVFEISLTILASLGGGGAIVLALSSYIGKIWASRILQGEKAEHDKEISEFKHRLESIAEKSSLNYQQKIELYKVATNPLIELATILSTEGLTKESLNSFDKDRLYITAQLSLFAPQTVFDSFNNLIDYIYDALENDSYSFNEFRVFAMQLLSEMRKDIGIYTDEITYNGHR